MRIDNLLKDKISACSDSRVRDAMEYSLLAGGKRIRPKLLYEVVKGYGKEESIADEFACALEMIHTYSLIHDDLPAMDNDELRRGNPTCHKMFDEATAILAGDGLLTYAFSTALSSHQNPESVIKCAGILADMAGPDGMVLGQDLDIQEESSITDWEKLKQIHHFKTGCLLSAPLMIGAVICGQNDSAVEDWKSIGMKLGLAFQVQDDWMDATETAEQLGKSNSDSRNDKVTSITLLGEENAKQLMTRLYEESCFKIKQIGGFESASLINFVREIQTRSK
ncbi:MAG: polyprenyl synthetase family protein [Erysipelotrichia bacterium]|nr:polyprenyl synthetase family protein [Erysipelotrichia bacterium]